ncbi:unnamed protein product [Camellia sinensis]
MARESSKFLELYGYDLLLGSIAAFYVFMVPYTKVEESFNVQLGTGGYVTIKAGSAMHDILYHRHHLENYDHLDFPGVVPRTFIGAALVSILASPIVSAMSLLHFPKIFSLFAGIRNKFGRQVEAFFVILTAIQFHVLFYCTRPLPNILALGLVNLAYGNWLKGNFYAALNCLIFATIIFRCDILLLLCPLGLELLLSMFHSLRIFICQWQTKSISLWKAIKCCIGAALFCIGLTVLVDSIMWRRLLWPEFEVLWFNSIAVFLDRRVLFYILPVFSFVLLYSKLPHKELRFIISSVPMFNLSAAIAASRIYNNRRKNFWNLLYVVLLGFLMISLGYTIITFMASYENYPSGYALRDLHKNEYSKEEDIPLEELFHRNFTFLLKLSMQTSMDSSVYLPQVGFPGFIFKLDFHPFHCVPSKRTLTRGIGVRLLTTPLPQL